MLRFFKACLACALAFGLSATMASAQERVLRFQHFLSPKSAIASNFITPWAEKVMKESNGRLKIEIYPAMQLGGTPPALYDQIRDGVIDGGWAIPSYTPGRFPEVEAIELPFITSLSAEDSSKAAWEYTQKHLQRRFGDIHVMAVHVHGPGIVHKKGEPVRSVADFRGLKLRGPNRPATKLLEAMGATAIGMPVPAFTEALSKGVVDGGVIPWEVVPALKVHELADSHTLIGGDKALYNIYFIWAMNKNSYNRLPADLKAVIDANSGLDTSAWAGRVMGDGDKVSEKVVRKTDNTIYTMGPSARKEVMAIGDQIIDEWIKEMTSRGLDGEGMVRDARDLVDKHSM